MNFDELLSTYKFVPPPEVPRPPPPVEPFGWRLTKPLVIVIELALLLGGSAWFFTWNDVKEQPASALPRRVDYVIFAFLTLYGFGRMYFDAFHEVRDQKRWKYFGSQLVAGAIAAFGVSLFWFYGSVSPPGPLLRISARYDRSKPERRRYAVLNSRSRSLPASSGSYEESGFYEIAEVGHEDKPWEVYLGNLSPSYGEFLPSYISLTHHTSSRSFDWIDRTNPVPTYELKRLLGYPDVDLDRVTAVFAELPLCNTETFAAGLDAFLALGGTEVFVRWPFGGWEACDSQEHNPKYKKLGEQAQHFLGSLGYHLTAAPVLVRCKNGDFHEVGRTKLIELPFVIEECERARTRHVDSDVNR